MEIAILSARRGWHTDELCRALADRGHTGRVLPYEGMVTRLGAASGSVDNGAGGQAASTRELPGGRLTNGPLSLLEADAVLARIIPAGSLEQIIYRVDALHWIERRGVVVMNSPRTIERTVDKFYTDSLLRDAGLPTPDTVVCEGVDEAMAAVRSMGDVVIKPIFGSMGHGLVRVANPDLAYRVLRPLEQMKSVFYVQRALDHGGRDWRVFVVGGQAIGAIERQAPPGEWRSNISRGGSARRIDVSPECARLAVRAAAAVGADYAGVDLLPSSDGVFVLEVNGIPGWQGLQQATDVDVAGAIVEHLVERVLQRSPSISELPV
ncbi:MAG TPA: RimK family alpha-L-glutamate ligase [Vicinamibacterales bacterium]|nr:RimK family alpha-L-glutamate ligase [Vicinamibacterales bacterium]